jgi:hypothetical protein
VNPHAERERLSKISHFIPQTDPTPPDQSDTTGQVFFDSRIIPTSPDQFDHMHPSFNPKVPGSRRGRPTNSTNAFRKFARIRTTHIPHSVPPMR